MNEPIVFLQKSPQSTDLIALVDFIPVKLGFAYQTPNGWIYRIWSKNKFVQLNAVPLTRSDAERELFSLRNELYSAITNQHEDHS